jgi:TPP-dependent pyruvate/acetoin dehydrogenase alpha subunit
MGSAFPRWSGRRYKVKIKSEMGRNSKKVSKTGKSRPKQNRQSPPILPAAASLEPTKLKQLYSTMLGCRMLADRIGLLASQGVIVRDLPVKTGHEALEVGALINLTEDDCVASGSREYVARFIQGMSLRKIFAGLSRRESASASQAEAGESASVNPILPWSSVATQLNQLTGAAWAFKLQKRPQVGVFVSSDPSSWTNGLPEAVSACAAYKLPVVYIVNKGQVEEPGAANLNGPSQDPDAASYKGLPCFMVDSTDAVAVYRVAQEAIRRARQGHGPAFIECRIWANASPASTSGTEDGASDDPLSRMEAQLRSRKLWSEKWKMKLVQNFTRQLDRAAAALRSAHPLRTAGLRTAGPTAPAPSPMISARTGDQAESGEHEVFEAHIVRDTSRLAGSRG